MFIQSWIWVFVKVPLVDVGKFVVFLLLLVGVIGLRDWNGNILRLLLEIIELRIIYNWIILECILLLI